MGLFTAPLIYGRYRYGRRELPQAVVRSARHAGIFISTNTVYLKHLKSFENMVLHVWQFAAFLAFHVYKVIDIEGC